MGEAKGSGYPSNALHDHSPGSSNSSEKIAGRRGGKADNLSNYSTYEYDKEVNLGIHTVCNLAILIAFPTIRAAFT